MVSAYSAIPVVCELAPESADDLAEIEAECNRPPWSRALFLREFSNRYSSVFGARLSGELVGFLVVHTVLDEAHVVNFGVRQSVRSKGVGRELITSMLWKLYEEGIKWVTLEVRRSNRVAIMLYTSLGFYECGIREKYYSDDGEDGVMMRLEIGRFVDLHSQGLSREAVLE